ncbi:MAG: hypothetical protein Q7T55_15245 [Solirubrobacteraceae bacterium]|nr:hypothetical protein [Solirubrobacteraceae bacterium]
MSSLSVSLREVRAAKAARRVLLVVLAAVAGFAMVGPVGPAQATAAATTCKPPKYPGQGYFTSLKVTGTSCSQGNKIAVAYYKCRTKKSKGGKCSGGVLGYRCTDVRKSIPTEIDGRVTCKKSKATVVHTYQQDL